MVRNLYIWKRLPPFPVRHCLKTTDSPGEVIQIARATTAIKGSHSGMLKQNERDIHDPFGDQIGIAGDRPFLRVELVNPFFRIRWVQIEE